MIFIDESESPVGLDTVRKIGITACDEDQIAFESTVFVDCARAVDAGVKTVVGAKLCEQSTFGENFRGRSRDE